MLYSSRSFDYVCTSYGSVTATYRAAVTGCSEVFKKTLQRALKHIDIPSNEYLTTRTHHGGVLGKIAEFWQRIDRLILIH